ncbi:MAG TPA: hypothetical protein DEQ87_08010 [Algoriphagus sp.]|jgi:ketosteroid isomerase-like protein|uniref:YybH family protein n=1 Tax=unclassified Algoriphagus TaxID=2641541 RepID=UPI000C4C425F|nr:MULTISPECIES: nuclear transport factor 2 family protein [unclassified Algoriphagus]MAL15833.1 hypothetical protein [Algoriphagus sp.]HAD49884.1 hypothetical protein [Algoriphagus sp.]HAS59236.1 hypothetical protein [Algoriphagus sp.]HAZ25321.1 hypothetical protein [Algoriphagus sp.]HCB44831.1 hypothetical protein [Algoriphagus sp.]|tara:strand:+ start:838 stop:1326 length:489 start_codon:yes stop_codon:yes gene_type:complete
MKSFITNTQLPLFLGLLLLGFSCQTPKQEISTNLQETVSADSLIQVWNKAWNSKDSTAISDFFNEQSVVIFSTNYIMTGKDSIMFKWVKNNLPNVSNLQTFKISSGNGQNLAYYSGTYSLDIVKNDSLLGTDKGIFTTVWKLQNDQNWKIENMIFGEYQEEE